MSRSFWFEIRAIETYWKHTMEVTEHLRRFTKRTNANGNKSRKLATPIMEKRYSVDWDIPMVETSKEDFDTWVNAGKPSCDSMYSRRPNDKLTAVDEMLCEFMGDPKPSPDRDSIWYQMLHEFAFSTLYTCGGSYIGDMQEHMPHMRNLVETWLDGSDDFTEPRKAAIRSMVEWALCEKWQFHACG